MKRILLLSTVVLSLLLLTSNLFSQQCSDCRYISPVFDSITKETVHFGRGVTINGDTQELYMDIYQPFGDTVSSRPVVMFAFGGGFVQGSKDDWYVYEVCKHFTKAGYVCAAMDYRVGINYLEILQLQHMRIFFRPMQDYRASVQYLKWDFAENGNNYRIDTNMIFAGGASAGAITALMMQYCDKPTEMGEMGNINALDALGGFYSTTGFHQNYSWNCAATISIAGALINANWVEPGDDPVISAHGNADNVVPYAYGALGGGLLGGIFDLQGDFVVDSIARSKGVCSYLYTMEGRDHPSESMGIEYFYSIVYRIMLRMEAVRTHKSFCCALNVDITPGDTLYYLPGAPVPSVLTAVVTNDSGNSQLHWCTMPCQLSSTANSITVTADSTLKYVAATVSEGNCLSADLHIVYDSTLVSSVTQPDVFIFSVYPQPASSLLNITADVSSFKNKSGTIGLTDVLGRLVHQQPSYASGGQLKATLDINGLPVGNYLLSVSIDGRKIGARRVMVAR